MSTNRAPIVQERVLPAGPEAVFAAWSDADSLRQWMVPGDLERAEAEVDFRVGGRFRIVMHGAERDYVQHGEYLAIEDGKTLSAGNDPQALSKVCNAGLDTLTGSRRVSPRAAICGVIFTRNSASAITRENALYLAARGLTVTIKSNGLGN